MDGLTILKYLQVEVYCLLSPIVILPYNLMFICIDSISMSSLTFKLPRHYGNLKSFCISTQLDQVFSGVRWRLSRFTVSSIWCYLPDIHYLKESLMSNNLKWMFKLQKFDIIFKMCLIMLEISYDYLWRHVFTKLKKRYSSYLSFKIY